MQLGPFLKLQAGPPYTSLQSPLPKTGHHKGVYLDTLGNDGEEMRQEVGVVLSLIAGLVIKEGALID